jgi:hypothetical protein
LCRNPGQEFRKRQKHDGPQHPLSNAPIDVEVGPSFMSQIHSRSRQSAERSRHCEIEQQLKKIE